MAISWEQWLRATGKPRTKANAEQWKRTHGVALGKYNPDGTPVQTPAPAPPPPPTPDPYLTPEGFGAASNPDAQAQIADLLAEYRSATGGTIDASGNFVAGPTSGTIESGYQQTVGRLNALRPQIEQSRQDALRRIASDVAGRGLVRSGIRAVDETRANTDATTSLLDVEREMQQAGTERAQALSDAAARLLRGRQDIENRAQGSYIGSRIEDFRNAYGGAVHQPETPTPEPQVPARTSSILAKWDRKPAYSEAQLQQRFGEGRLAKRGGNRGYVYTNRKRAR